MVMCRTGRNRIAAMLGRSGTKPGWTAIGSGSGAVTIHNTGLAYHVDRQAFSAVDITSARFITMTSTWSAVDMSGIGLTEFGIFNTGSSDKCYNREGFAAIEFDGTIELSIDTTFEIY